MKQIAFACIMLVAVALADPALGLRSACQTRA